jgi:hypothetical protein
LYCIFAGVLSGLIGISEGIIMVPFVIDGVYTNLGQRYGCLYCRRYLVAVINYHKAVYRWLAYNFD